MIVKTKEIVKTLLPYIPFLYKGRDYFSLQIHR